MEIIREGTRLYTVWKGMRQRCANPNRSNYRYYGGRGISVCDEWSDYRLFSIWANRNGYSDKLTIDRIDNDGDYRPDNCRFITRCAQSRNTRKVMSTNKSGYRGVSWNKGQGKWRASICVDNKRIHLGSFSSSLDAKIARDLYVIENKLGHTLN